MADLIAKPGEVPQDAMHVEEKLADRPVDEKQAEEAPTTRLSLKGRFCDKFRLKKGKAKSCMDVTDVDEVTGVSPPGDAWFIIAVDAGIPADGKAESGDTEEVPPQESVEEDTQEDTAPKTRMTKIKNAFRKRKNKRTDNAKEAAADEIKDVAEIAKDDEDREAKGDLAVNGEATLLKEAEVTAEPEDKPKVHVVDADEAEAPRIEEKGYDGIKTEEAGEEVPQVEEVKIGEEEVDKEKGHEVFVGEEKPGRLARFKKWLAKRGKGIRRVFTSCIPTRQD